MRRCHKCFDEVFVIHEKHLKEGVAIVSYNKTKDFYSVVIEISGVFRSLRASRDKEVVMEIWRKLE